MHTALCKRVQEPTSACSKSQPRNFSHHSAEYFSLIECPVRRIQTPNLKPKSGKVKELGPKKLELMPLKQL